jgi:uncharacterized protein (DUF305 family)
VAPPPPARDVTRAATPPAPPTVEASGSDCATTVRLDLVVTPGTAGPNAFHMQVVSYDPRQPYPATRVSLAFSPPARPDLGSPVLERRQPPLPVGRRAAAASLAVRARPRRPDRSSTRYPRPRFTRAPKGSEGRSRSQGGIVRVRVGRWAIAVALLAAGCRGPAPHPGPPAFAGADRTDVWFMQHTIPHLWQEVSIAALTRAQVTHPALGRLADTIARRDQADIDQLQGWLALQGLAPHGHSHQRVDNRKQTDLQRLSELRGTAFDLAFVEVMTARDRAGITLATAEVRHGTRPEVRRLAKRMLSDQQAEIRQMNAWKQAWSTRRSP